MKIVKPDDIESSPLQLVIRWYSDQSPGDEWPPTEVFMPDRIPVSALPHIGRVDVELDPFRVFYRALGRVMCESIGQQVSRRYLDELDLPQKDDIAGWYRTAVSANRPLFVRGEQQIDNVSFIYEGICLPLGNATDDPRAFLIGEDYLQTEEWRKALRHRRYDPIGR